MFTYIRGLLNKYKNLKGNLSDHQLARKIVSIFPENLIFTPVKLLLKKEAKENGNCYKLESVVQELEEAAKATSKRSLRLSENHRKPKTTFTQTVSKKKLVRRNCGELGHPHYKCRNPKKNGVFCYFCGADGHKADVCPKRSTRKSSERSSNYTKKERDENTDVEITIWSTFTENSGKTRGNSEKVDNVVTFCLDSGSTNHCCSRKTMLTNLRTVDEFFFVNSFGEKDNGNTSGDIQGELSNGKRILLKDVLFAPKLKANLLSVQELSKKGLTTRFKKKFAEIFREDTGEVVHQAHFNGKFYEVNLKLGFPNEMGRTVNKTQAEQAAKTFKTIDLWHHRFGHLSKPYLDEMLRKEHVHGLDYSRHSELSFCHGCSKGKLRKSNARKFIDYQKTDVYEPKEVLEKLSLDTVGPFETKSRGGYRGFVTCTDHFSRFRWLIFIKSRKEVPYKLIELFKRLTTKLGKTIKILRCDQGSEFNNRILKTFAKKMGISFEFSSQYTPNQNGVAERSNGLVLEGLRSMLLNSKLGKSYWSYAAKTKCYLLNRSYSKPINKTPYEVIYKRKPKVTHLRVFGSFGYSRNLRPKAGKLNPRGVPVILLGYCTNQKGYIVKNLSTNRIETAGSAVFDENLSVAGAAAKEKLTKKPMENFSAAPCEPLEKEKESNFGYMEDLLEPNDETLSQSYHSKNREERPKNFLDINTDNILDSEAGVQTGSRHQKKNREANMLVAYQTKVEAYTNPKSYHDLEGRMDCNEWKAAYNKELKKLEDVGKMKVVEKPKNAQVIPLLELFSRKHDNISGKNIFKCRFVARGDLEKTSEVKNRYSPVASLEATHLFIALAAHFGCNIRQCDVSTAFLYGTLNRYIHLELPQSLKKHYGKNFCWTTNRSLYGLTDAPKAWHNTVKRFLCKQGFKKCPVEESLFFFKHDDVEIYLLLYVDDILYFSKDDNALTKFETVLKKKFDVKFKQTAEKFIGLEISQEDSHITIGQTQYVEQLLKTFEMESGKSYNTPMEMMLVPDNDGTKLNDIRLYQSLIGGLLYLNQASRPDLCYSVNQLSKFNREPSATNLKQAKRVLKYLKSSANKKIAYKKNSEKINIDVFVDAEYGRHKKAKSVYGYVINFNEAPIAFKTKQQQCTSLSSTESEFIAIAEVAKKVMWLKNVFEFLKVKHNVIKMYNDNQSSIRIATNSGSCNRTKHINIRHFYVQELLENEEFELMYVPTTENIADLFTKSLGRVKFHYFVSKLFKKMSENESKINENREI